MQQAILEAEDTPRAEVKVAPCRHGTFVFWPHDKYIGRALDEYGEYSEGEVKLFAQLLKPGHVVVEVGSNIGTLTVPLAKLVGASGRVFAFEPQRIVFQQMCANLALNALFNVWASPCAVGSRTGEIGVPPVDYSQEGNFGGVELMAKSPEMVQMMALDDTPFRPDFLKIDVEGMEIDVLLGGQKKIETCRPAIYCENDRAIKSPALIQALIDLKYDMWWHMPPLFNPDNFRGAVTNFYGPMVSVNMLCFPSELKLKVNGLRAVNGPDDVWDRVLQ